MASRPQLLGYGTVISITQLQHDHPLSPPQLWGKHPRTRTRSRDPTLNAHSHYAPNVSWEFPSFKKGKEKALEKYCIRI